MLHRKNTIWGTNFIRLIEEIWAHDIFLNLCLLQFNFHPPSGMRFLSKGEVLRYVNEGKISACDMDLLCDTSTDDNV